MIPLLLALLPFALANIVPAQQSGLEKRKNCDSESCITFYADGRCTSGYTIGSYKPNCTGACFLYDSFASIEISGSKLLFGYVENDFLIHEAHVTNGAEESRLRCIQRFELPEQSRGFGQRAWK